jgi:peptide/nickel transport system substrate-binding protein
MTMRRLCKRLVAFALLPALLGESACRRSSDPDSGGLPRAQTLYVAGRQWGEPTSFNPLHSNPAWPVTQSNLMYETLLVWDPMNGKLVPLLAESFVERDDSIEVTLNAQARWSDGKPVTGWDVKYSFDVGEHHKSLPMAPVWKHISAVRLLDADGKPVADAPTDGPGYPRRVVFQLDATKKLNPLGVLDALVEVRIVPRHVFEPLAATLGGPDEVVKLKCDQNPVISGPYQLLRYGSEKIVTERRPDYWGNRALFGGKQPVPRYVVHPIYKGNDHFSIALQQGRLDMSSTFVPRIWRKASKGVGAWFDHAPYFAPTSLPMLIVNVKRGPLGDVTFRRAMAAAINYTDIRELAASGYSDPLQPGLILPFGRESKFFSAEDTKRYGVTYDPARAKQLLTEAGYSAIYGDNHELLETRDKRGNRVPTLFIKSPTGWSDWESIVKIAVRGLREAGIDVRERFVDANLFWTAGFTGDFDLIMNTPATYPTPSRPWSRFETVLTTRDFAPIGQKIYKNVGRFNDPSAPGYVPRIDELLGAIPTIKDEAELVTAYRELNVLFMQQQPTIPLMYRPDVYYEYSTRHWTNFPTANNPYNPQQMPGEKLGTRMLWHLEPVPQD